MIDRLAVHQAINNKSNIGDRTDFIVVFNELIVCDGLVGCELNLRNGNV